MDHNEWRLLAATLIVLAVTRSLNNYYKRYRLPPGPPALPIIGNALNFPSTYEWLTFAEWSKEYNSDVIYTSLFGQSIVILNTFAAADELLIKNSAVTSNRPTYTMMNELSGAGWMFAFMKYGDEWKQKRTLFHRVFRNKESYQPDALAVIRKFLPQFLHDPKNVEHYLFRMPAALAMRLGYGIDIPFEEDEHTRRIERGQQCIRSASLPGRYFVDYLPVLQYLPSWFPGCGFLKEAAVWRKHVAEMKDAPFHVAKEELAKGGSNASFVGVCLGDSFESEKRDKATEEMVNEVAGNLYTAGADTTAATLSVFLLLIVSYPEAQAKAQEELDRVLGNRLPNFSDKGDLPYVTALVKEVLRYHPSAPMAVAHVADADTIVCGYSVPAKSIIIPNAWAMLQDESLFGPNTSEFRPERFLKNGKLNSDIPHPDFGLGFGRRKCAGQDIAESFLWISIASLLTCFKFSKPRDKVGVEPSPSIPFTSGLVSRALPFDCVIERRSNCEALLHNEDTIAG